MPLVAYGPVAYIDRWADGQRPMVYAPCLMAYVPCITTFAARLGGLAEPALKQLFRPHFGVETMRVGPVISNKRTYAVAHAPHATCRDNRPCAITYYDPYRVACGVWHMAHE